MKTKEEHEFMDIIADNKGRILRICKAYGQSPDDVHDLFQEIIFAVWKALPGFRKQCALSTWIYRITLNICLKYSLRTKKTKENQVSLQGICFEIADSEQVAKTAEQNEMVQHLKEVIAALKGIDKNLILLYLDDVSYREIAAITGLNESNVGVRLHRIKAKIFNSLKEHR